MIEQAIYTSVLNDRLGGYQVAAASPGVTDAETRELAEWGPAHDSLLSHQASASSINFFRMACGRLAISRTVRAGAEYSQRAGGRISTHFLLTPADVFSRFANDPFALINAASATGKLHDCEEAPRQIGTLRLVGRASHVPRSRLTRLARSPGIERLTSLLELAGRDIPIGVVWRRDPNQLISGMISLIPPQFRAEYSFSTGLKASPRRPFRIILLPPEPSEQRLAIRRCSLTLWSGTGANDGDQPLHHPWPELVRSAYRNGGVAALADVLQEATHTEAEDLDHLGRSLRETFSCA